MCFLNRSHRFSRHLCTSSLANISYSLKLYNPGTTIYKFEEVKNKTYTPYKKAQVTGLSNVDPN